MNNILKVSKAHHFWAVLNLGPIGVYFIFMSFEYVQLFWVIVYVFVQYLKKILVT